ncbi:MAG TPA: ABC transporter permease [bacterium]|nr:ABC transporter permease [bacterium]
MKKTLTLIKREYLARVRTKGFIIGTLAMPFLVFILIGVQMLTAQMGAREKKTLAVMDLTGRIAPVLQKHMSETYKNSQNEPLYQFEHVAVIPESLASLKARYTRRVQSEKVSALIVLPQDVFDKNAFEVYARNISNMEFNSNLERAVSYVVSGLRLEQSGLDQALVRRLTQRLELRTFKVSEEGTKEESGMVMFGISYAMILILYTALLMYGQFVMRGVYEDKNSRVVEVLLSSVRPDQFMAGKIIGIGGAGLTQFLVWALFVALGSTYGMLMVKQMAPGAESLALPTISFSIYLFFFIFFIFGYFIYATLYAALGSMVNDEADAQSLQWPVTILILMGFLAMFFIINNPNSTLAVVLSLIPFFAPLLMFLRYTVGAAPLYQVLLSIAVMIASIYGLIWLTGRVFRVGILLYGKRATLPEVVKWIKYS